MTREERNARRRDYCSKHPEKVRQWYRNCRANGTHTSVNGKNLEWYHQNRNHAKKLHRKWCRKNSIQILAYMKKRELRSPSAKMARIMRDRLHSVLRRIKKRKPTSTRSLVGCDWVTLSNWIESQFSKGMSWNNHGLYGWHVDHIIPCSIFDLTDPIQLGECFHYTNLQPLWAEDNWEKSDLVRSTTR